MPYGVHHARARYRRLPHLPLLPDAEGLRTRHRRDKLRRIAQEAKSGCPVSKLMNADITLDVAVGQAAALSPPRLSPPKPPSRLAKGRSDLRERAPFPRRWRWLWRLAPQCAGGKGSSSAAALRGSGILAPPIIAAAAPIETVRRSP